MGSDGEMRCNKASSPTTVVTYKTAKRIKNTKTFMYLVFGRLHFLELELALVDLN